MAVEKLSWVRYETTTNQSKLTHIKRKWGDRERGPGRWPGYVMSTKVILDERKSVLSFFILLLTRSSSSVRVIAFPFIFPRAFLGFPFVLWFSLFDAVFLTLLPFARLPFWVSELPFAFPEFLFFFCYPKMSRLPRCDRHPTVDR